MTFDIGDNLTAVLIALVAIIPAVIAAFYAHRASTTTTATGKAIDGRMTDMLQAKDDLIVAANTATAYAQGQASPSTVAQDKNNGTPS